MLTLFNATGPIARAGVHVHNPDTAVPTDPMQVIRNAQVLTEGAAAQPPDLVRVITGQIRLAGLHIQGLVHHQVAVRATEVLLVPIAHEVQEVEVPATEVRAEVVDQEVRALEVRAVEEAQAVLLEVPEVRSGLQEVHSGPLVAADQVAADQAVDEADNNSIIRL